jgi:lysyl-tRNA synthetase, class II
MQAYARLDALGEQALGRIEHLDIGDVIGVEGDLYVTKRGQLALAVRECTMLAKALRDPPDLFHGIADPEVRHRQRELDLMANERSREVFAMRAKLVAAIRAYMNEHDFIELETPMLQHMTGGAAARPFSTHHNTLNRELFLRTATELYLKRCIVGGFENVYELGKFFRNEGMSPQHNPEFTMLEWFLSCADYNGVMAFAEQMISTVVEQVLGTTKVERGGETIDFKAPWRRLTLRDAILEATGADIISSSRDELAELMEGEIDPKADWAAVVDAIQGKVVEPMLTQPTFVIDLPLDIWPLVKPHPEHPKLLGEAFDGIVAGMEIIGGGTDVNDPDMQREHFVRQRERQEAGSESDPHPHDEEFVRALEYGMLTASGSGIGIDRLMMVIAGAENLRDVILFPSMRPAADG